MENYLDEHFETIKRENVLHCLSCHLCKEPFIEAVYISECLHTFCKKCIFDKMIDENLNCCPICKKYLGKEPLNKISGENVWRVIRRQLFDIIDEIIDEKKSKEIHRIQANKIKPHDIIEKCKRKEISLSSSVDNLPNSENHNFNIFSKKRSQLERTRNSCNKNKTSSSKLSTKNQKKYYKIKDGVVGRPRRILSILSTIMEEDLSSLESITISDPIKQMSSTDNNEGYENEAKETNYDDEDEDEEITQALASLTQLADQNAAISHTLDGNETIIATDSKGKGKEIIVLDDDDDDNNEVEEEASGSVNAEICNPKDKGKGKMDQHEEDSIRSMPFLKKSIRGRKRKRIFTQIKKRAHAPEPVPVPETVPLIQVPEPVVYEDDEVKVTTTGGHVDVSQHICFTAGRAMTSQHICFTLLPRENQEGGPPLPEILPINHFRTHNRDTEISVVEALIERKINIEVEVWVREFRLHPSMSLRNVWTIWCQTGPDRAQSILSMTENAVQDCSMILTYTRRT